MPGRLEWVARALCLVSALAASPARGEPPVVVLASERLGAGYDTNPALSPPPDILPTIGDLGGRVLSASDTSLGAYVGEALWGGLSLDADARWYMPGDGDHEARLDALSSAKAGWDGRSFSALLALEGGRYAATFGADDAWSGRSLLRGVWKPIGFWQIGAQVGGGLRAYDQGGELDRSFSVGADLSYRAPLGYVLAGLELDRRDSDEPTAIRTELAPRIAAGLALGSLTLDAQYLLLRRFFDTPGADGAEHLVRVDACYWLLPWLGIFGTGELGIARGNAGALAYDRVMLLGGLAIRLAPPPSAREARRRALDAQGPATLTRGGVRFRVRAKGARQVSVIGTFNAWRTDEAELHPAGDDWFETTIRIPPGRHRYRFVVDGRNVRAEGAPAYAPDDFGGDDAVLVVPERGE